jgi:hypothetical protein
MSFDGFPRSRSPGQVPGQGTHNILGLGWEMRLSTVTPSDRAYRLTVSTRPDGTIEINVPHPRLRATASALSGRENRSGEARQPAAQLPA